jgi:hypothetical protein
VLDEERTYQETTDAWRTFCRRLPVWEDANDRHLVDEFCRRSFSHPGQDLLEAKRPHIALARIPGGIEGKLDEPLNLHCVGGFVVTYFYGFPRATGDLDYYTAVPANLNLLEVTGEGSKLHKKFGVCLHKAAVMTLPEDYATQREVRNRSE